MKMLTQLHMEVYTCWCWHIYKGGGFPRVERSVDFLVLTLVGAFEKNKSIFSIAPMRIW